MAIKYYICDTETTGLSTISHEIIEISMIRCDDRVQLTQFIRAEKPENASLDALKITSKTFADLLKGKSKEDAVSQIEIFFKDDGLTPNHRCLVCHNVSFDKKFLFALFEKVGKEFPAWLWLDTIALTNEFIKISDPATLNITKTATGKISRKLHAACDLVGVQKSANQHDAKSDTISTYYLWKKLIEEKNINHLPHIKTIVHKLKSNETTPVEDLDMADIY